MKRAVIALIAGVACSFAAPAIAHADPDTDFARELHTHGIYGQKDYNAWIGKITCKRLYNNVDTDAFASATFVGNQLDRHSSTDQVWQFLGLAINYYCPDKRGILDAAAAQH